MNDIVEITSSVLGSMPLPILESGDKEARGRVLGRGGLH
jgi:hypothetical protein